jgi:hypothetical protein
LYCATRSAAELNNPHAVRPADAPTNGTPAGMIADAERDAARPIEKLHASCRFRGVSWVVRHFALGDLERTEGILERFALKLAREQTQVVVVRLAARPIKARESPSRYDQKMRLPEASESSLLRVAYACLDGLKIFATGNNFHSRTIIPVAILEAHCPEVTMKCHLMQNRWTHSDVRELGHDLRRCWNEASKVATLFDEEPPHWLELLNWGHSSPYAFRYLPSDYGAGCPLPCEFVAFTEPKLEALRWMSERIL